MSFLRLIATDPVGEPGQRLSLSHAGEDIILSVERTQPEQVMNPDARRVDVEDVIILDPRLLRWLVSSGRELLATLDIAGVEGFEPVQTLGDFSDSAPTLVGVDDE